MGDDDLQDISRRISTWLLDLISFLTDTVTCYWSRSASGSGSRSSIYFLYTTRLSSLHTTQGVLLAIQGFLSFKCTQLTDGTSALSSSFAVVGVKGMILLDDLFGLQTS